MPELREEGKLEERTTEFIAKFKEFLLQQYRTELHTAASDGRALTIDFSALSKFSLEFADLLLVQPAYVLEEVCPKSVEQIDLPEPARIRFSNLPVLTNIRDLRSKHISTFVAVEGTVRKASEIRPEIIETVWECAECGQETTSSRKGNMVFRPFQCSNSACRNRAGFKQARKKMIDTRWIVIEEPFELTEGERPSQVTIQLTEDLVSPEGRRNTDPGNRLRITGILREIPKGKLSSAKLDFYLDANHVEPVETGWHHLEITTADEKEIRALSERPDVYDLLVDSLAPSLYGLREIKESIILQLFGGVPRTLKDGMHFRGDIHLLLIGDPASGKSQLLKLVPTIVPRGKYVSGKGVTGAGLCMSYDTLIHLAHGQIQKIGDIVEECLKQESTPINNGLVSTKGDIEILCLDSTDLKIKKQRVSHFFKLRYGKDMTVLRTQSGREIKVTQENPVLVIENGVLQWRQACKLTAGDYIATARYLPLNELPVNETAPFARFCGMVCGDGDIGQREIRFHNTSTSYLDEFARLSSSLGFRPRHCFQNNRIPCVRVASKSLCEKLGYVGVPRSPKADKICIPEEFLKSNELLSEFLLGIFSCDGGVVEKGRGSYIEFTTTSKQLARQIQTALLRFSILSKLRKREPSPGGFGGKKKKYVIVIRGVDYLKRFSTHIGFMAEKNEKLQKTLARYRPANTNIDVIPNIGETIGNLRKSLGITIKNDPELSLLRHYEKGRRLFSRESLARYADILNTRKAHDYFVFLQRLSSSDIFWDKIESISTEKAEWVYDLTVDGEHNFIANDFIVHNTATVTKDEQFMGGWVLEAGALVLANKGLLSVDEFEKMAPEDQVAMHEALEQGTISIAKASIVATLPAQTSVLAGGNPKFSRFDPYMAIAKQITIPDTLLSRFDLKFALRDMPDAEIDRKVVDHVLKTREADYEAAVPRLNRDLIRRYIAYAKEHCRPELTEETGNLLKTFYMKTRKRAEGGGAVPITLRQFEALLRLSEASAKVQLRDMVNKTDAERAIRLMRYSLRQLGFDPETGQIDIDRSEGGTPASERSKIRVVLDIINEMSLKKKEISLRELEERAKKEGIEEFEDIIEKLKREGLLFEPTPGYVQKV